MGIHDFDGYLALNTHILRELDSAHRSLANETVELVTPILQHF